MIANVLLVVGVLLLIFIGFIASREGKFHYERSGVIHASAAEIFPYISDFRKGELWSPYEKMDPAMKKTFRGPEAQVGSIMEFEGKPQAGSGSLEILKLVPNELVEIRLIMTKPFPADNIVRYKLSPESDGTRFTWTMSGDGGFIGKLLNFFVDCEALVAGQFSEGINSLKELVESQRR